MCGAWLSPPRISGPQRRRTAPKPAGPARREAPVPLLVGAQGGVTPSPRVADPKSTHSALPGAAATRARTGVSGPRAGHPPALRVTAHPQSLAFGQDTGQGLGVRASSPPPSPVPLRARTPVSSPGEGQRGTLPRLGAREPSCREAKSLRKVRGRCAPASGRRHCPARARSARGAAGSRGPPPGGALPAFATAVASPQAARSVPAAPVEPGPVSGRRGGCGALRGASRWARRLAAGSAQERGAVIICLARSSGARCEFNDGAGGSGGEEGEAGAGAAESRAARGRGVSARPLTAGIWGVIERGGRPGARVGLHEQLNVIRPRPSRSSCVIDNPAAFLPGPRHQTGCRRRAGPGPRAGTRPFPALAVPCWPRRPRLQGQTRGPALFLR